MNGLFDWFKGHWDNLLLFGVPLLGIPTLIASATKVASDPLYYGMAVFFIILIALGATAFAWCSSRIVESKILDCDGRKRIGSEYTYGPLTRYGLLLGTIAMVAITSTHIIAKSPTKVASELSKFADVSSQGWVGDGAIATTETGEELPYALMMDRNSPDLLVLDGRAAAILFDVAKRDRAEFVRLDSIQVEVVDYKPCPPYQLGKFFGAGQRPELYVAEIDSPSRAGKTIFTAYYVPGVGQADPKSLESHTKTIVENSIPQSILLRILAKSPGIYTLKCNVTLSNGQEKQTETVAEQRAILFDKFDIFADENQPTPPPDFPPTK